MELTLSFNPATRQLIVKNGHGPAVAFVLDDAPPAQLASATTATGAAIRHRFGCRVADLEGVKCPRTFTTKRGRARHETIAHGPRNPA